MLEEKKKGLLVKKRGGGKGCSYLSKAGPDSGSVMIVLIGWTVFCETETKAKR